MASIKCGNCGQTHGSVAEVRSCYGGGSFRRAERTQPGGAYEPTSEPVKVTEGVWRTPDGTVYKVQTSRGYGGGEAGRLYGKMLVKRPEPIEKTKRGKTYVSTHELVYAPGAVRIIATSGGVQLDDEAAAKVGGLASVCMFCGLDLTDERSQYVGYGKDCAENRGLPWGELPTIIDPTTPANGE